MNLIEKYIRERKIKLYKSNPKCYWCDKPLTWKTATADHVNSKWTVERHLESELSAEIVLSCKPCNILRAARDQMIAFEKYPELRKLKETDIISLKTFFSSVHFGLIKTSRGLIKSPDCLAGLLKRSLFIKKKSNGKHRRGTWNELINPYRLGDIQIIRATQDILKKQTSYKDLKFQLGARSLLRNKKDIILYHSEFYPGNKWGLFTYLFFLYKGTRGGISYYNYHVFIAEDGSSNEDAIEAHNGFLQITSSGALSTQNFADDESIKYRDDIILAIPLLGDVDQIASESDLRIAVTWNELKNELMVVPVSI